MCPCVYSCQSPGSYTRLEYDTRVWLIVTRESLAHGCKLNTRKYYTKPRLRQILLEYLPSFEEALSTPVLNTCGKLGRHEISSSLLHLSRLGNCQFTQWASKIEASILGGQAPPVKFLGGPWPPQKFYRGGLAPQN